MSGLIEAVTLLEEVLNSDMAMREEDEGRESKDMNMVRKALSLIREHEAQAVEGGATKREEALCSELAAHRAVDAAARELSRLMDEVARDKAGQNDRVFSHFEFDQLRYALSLVDGLRQAAEAPSSFNYERHSHGNT